MFCSRWISRTFFYSNPLAQQLAVLHGYNKPAAPSERSRSCLYLCGSITVQHAELQLQLLDDLQKNNGTNKLQYSKIGWCVDRGDSTDSSTYTIQWRCKDSGHQGSEMGRNYNDQTRADCMHVTGTTLAEPLVVQMRMISQATFSVTFLQRGTQLMIAYMFTSRGADKLPEQAESNPAFSYSLCHMTLRLDKWQRLRQIQ